MRPPRADSSDTLVLSAGYELRVTWDDARKSLNESPLYQSLRESDGVLSREFVEKAGAIAKHSRRLEAALELATLAREVAAGKESTPFELFGRAAKFLGLQNITLLDAALEVPGQPVSTD